MNARSRPASYENARDSRRIGVSSRAERKRWRSWPCRLRRTRKVVDRSLRLIETSCRVVEAAERFAARRPLRAARQYRRVSDVLNEVTVQLSAAGQTLQTGACELGPEALARATAHWAAATQKLFVLTGRLGDTFDLIMEAVGSGATLDLSNLIAHPIGNAPRVIRLRPRPARRLSLGSSCNRVLHLRRRRSVAPTFAEAARRIFRGRAPPLVSTCPL
jgi:hypothetical protein